MKYIFYKIYAIAMLLFLHGIFADLAIGQDDEDCMMCHEDETLEGTINGRTVSVFVSGNHLKNSVHKGVGCAECHPEAAEDMPHGEVLPAVNCGLCHEDALRHYNNGIHGQAFNRNDIYAPDCKECHGKHDILPRDNTKSRTYKMNIPVLCGKCHREGAPVARVYDVSEHNILENYSQDIHGKGLFKSGLIVSATCNDCHGNHLVLPHSNPWSSVAPQRIAQTCMKCHVKIEDVHEKVIQGELWEKKPGAIPACSDCHLPHRVTIKDLAATMSNQSCMKCHSDTTIHKIVDGEKISLTVKESHIENSAHKNINCVKCHSDVTANLERPCETSGRVDCAACHAETSRLYYGSGHGEAFLRNDPNAPYCTDCHGEHAVKYNKDPEAKSYRGYIPELCGECHKEDGKASMSAELTEINSFSDYSQSVHGKGLKGKGLLVSAVCTDCHTAHNVLHSSNELSTVYYKNVPATCATCHKGIYDEYIRSDHAINNQSDAKFPTCADCHSSHTITNIDSDSFMYEVMYQCGQCHEDLSDSYFTTYHGKAYMLGSENAAKCSDCHGSHLILGMEHPESTVGEANIVNTCKQCHANANEKFTGYLTHATHYNPEKFPELYYTYWAMTSLLIFVFIIFGIHTLLWLPRAIMERRRKRKAHVAAGGEVVYFKRFRKKQIITHLMVIVSFLLLAFTGMLLKFAHMPWAQFTVKFVGGVEAAGFLHRVGAVITFAYFVFHVINLIQIKRQKKIKFGKFVFGKDSLMFNKQDAKDLWATLKWFVGRGPRPAYGRWTYWEKFDYMAVFWGVAVIGFSGLMLWFPEFFSIFFPGKFINIAQIIHSDEALMAVGFIFTVHFFNTHLRPDAFPMDTVIFTGHTPLEHYKEERAQEIEDLEKEGRLDEMIAKREFSQLRMNVIRTFGFIAVGTGVVIVALIIYSLLAG